MYTPVSYFSLDVLFNTVDTALMLCTEYAPGAYEAGRRAWMDLYPGVYNVSGGVWWRTMDFPYIHSVKSVSYLKDVVRVLWKGPKKTCGSNRGMMHSIIRKD